MLGTDHYLTSGFIVDEENVIDFDMGLLLRAYLCCAHTSYGRIPLDEDTIQFVCARNDGNIFHVDFFKNKKDMT